MKKVITYGTYDVLHYGHIALLKRAKALGDFLIVGVTADDFDKNRGKINVIQSLSERIESVRKTGLADEIIVEEYEGQKIDDIRRYDVDIFTVGDDWYGQFDYLKEFCKVVYLPRTQGVSSSLIRSERSNIRLGVVGNYFDVHKYASEVRFVNGLILSGFCSDDNSFFRENFPEVEVVTDDYLELLSHVDAVYIYSHPTNHYSLIKEALLRHKHVLCESPLVLSYTEYKDLHLFAAAQNLILMDSIKTAYSIAYSRLVLLVKSGKIGDVVAVDAVCTSMEDLTRPYNHGDLSRKWNSISAWGPTALLPVFQILGVDYVQKTVVTSYLDEHIQFDGFTNIQFVYPNAVASILVGKGIKSEGELVISGTKGFVYVPSPWWKTDYFEIRFENPSSNKRYFYQLDGEGIRYELLSFMRSIESGVLTNNIQDEVSSSIIKIVEDFYSGKDQIVISSRI